MINKDINDHIFEALFRQAVIDNYEEELSGIPSEEVLSGLYSFSDMHAARVKKLFLHEERVKRFQAAIKWARRSVAVIIASVLVVSGALATVPEVRAAVKAVIVEWFGQFTKFTSGREALQETQEWEPSYVPDGFTEDERYGDFGRRTIRYSDADGKAMTFTYISQSDSVSLDNEERSFSNIEMAGVTYYTFEAETSDKESSIIWDSDEYRFTVSGQLPVEELLKIAESVK